MDMETKVPQTYLENTNMLNSATLLMNGRNNNFLLNSNSNILPNNENKMLNSYFLNTNSFNKTKNDFSTNIQSKTQNTFFNTRNNYNNRQNTPLLNKMNNTQQFAWKEIMNNNNIIEDENQLENPLIKNILNSKINENEIQNIPENYLINLINTLQGVASKAIENKNNLEIENKKLYNYLSDMNTNYNNMAQANSKMSQSITKLKRQNNEQKNLIKNYENNNYLYNNNSKDMQIDNYLYKKNFGKFPCKLCTNKIFKSKYYLDEHIKRRHPDTYDIKNNKENVELEQRKLTKIFEKKLNEMKKYFDLLINSSIKKTQYIRLNEKLNSLQSLVSMSKQQEYLINNNYYYNYNNNYNNDYNYNNNSDINIRDEKFSGGENNVNNINNLNLNENNTIKLKAKNNYAINNNNENDEETNQKIIQNLNNQIKILKNEMNHFFNKSKTELLEINREKHFQAIKNYFEKNHNDNISIHQTRRNKKIKTIKASNNIIFNNINNKENDELNQSADEIKKELDNNNINNIDVFQSHKKMGKDLLRGVNSLESNNKNNTNREENKKNSNTNIIDINKNNLNNNNAYDNNNTFRKQSNNDSEEKTEKKEGFFKNGVKISFSGSENHSIQKDSPLVIFFDKFRDRDALFSKAQEEDYLKEIIKDDDIKLDKKEIEKIVDEKIEKKLININTTNNEDLVSDIIKLNYQIFDQNLIYGDAFCFYSRNISLLMDTKKLINEANNYYYHYREVKDIKNIQDRGKEANQNLFETVNYQVIKDSPSFESEFSLRNN